MKKLFKKLAGIKTFDIDNDGKIESLRDEVTGLFSEFKKMHDKLGEVNSELSTVILEEEIVLERANKRIEQAKAELQANKGLQSRVSDFIL